MSTIAKRTLDWKQDTSDYSWFATDDHGCFFRITPVLVPPDYNSMFACAWTELSGLRMSSYLSVTLEEARSRMGNLAVFKDGYVFSDGEVA